jgi:hypothetical protein
MNDAEMQTFVKQMYEDMNQKIEKYGHTFIPQELLPAIQ